MYICAGGKELSKEGFGFAKSVGVGLIDSAIKLSRICLLQTQSDIIFIGSAGSYDSKVGIGDIFYSVRATQLELSFLEAKSYTPIDNSVGIENFMDVLRETSLDFQNLVAKILKNSIPQTTINSSNYITNTDRFNAMMLRSGILLENMEFFSILKVAEYFKTPCIGIFCVSNYVCEEAHKQFLQNHNRVKKILNNFINESL